MLMRYLEGTIKTVIIYSVAQARLRFKRRDPTELFGEVELRDHKLGESEAHKSSYGCRQLRQLLFVAFYYSYLHPRMKHYNIMSEKTVHRDFSYLTKMCGTQQNRCIKRRFIQTNTTWTALCLNDNVRM